MKHIITLLFLCLSMQSFAQDPFFTQYMLNPFRYNPAYAGVDGTNILESINRVQWPELGGGFKTTMLNYNTSLDKINSGIGTSILYNIQGKGIFNDFVLKTSYNYKINFSEDHSIRLGTSVGFKQSWVNTSGLTFDSQFNGTSNLSQPSGEDLTGGTTSFITDLGFNYSFQNFYLMGSTSIRHFYKKTPIIRNAYYGLIGYDINFNDDVKLSPSLYIIRQGSASLYDINLSFYFKKLITGFTYRYKTTVAFIAGFKFAQRFQLVGSWDYRGQIRGTAGSYELSLRYQPKQKSN